MPNKTTETTRPARSNKRRHKQPQPDNRTAPTGDEPDPEREPVREPDREPERQPDLVPPGTMPEVFPEERIIEQDSPPPLIVTSDIERGSGTSDARDGVDSSDTVDDPDRTHNPTRRP